MCLVAGATIATGQLGGADSSQELLGCCDRGCSIRRLVLTMEANEHVFVVPTRRAHVDESAADCDLILNDGVVAIHCDHSRWRLRLE